MERRLLIMEDDRLMAEAAADYFTAKGWSVKTSENGVLALELLKTMSFHLILLDVMMPKMDGFTLCRGIREESDVPIIFITARVLEEDMLYGYALGADDYVTKPFSLPVLYAKAKALTERVQKKASLLEAGGLKVDVGRRQVLRDGNLLSLPPKEYEILLFFLKNPGRTFSREQLLVCFWGYDFDGNERVVDNHIKKLRKAIGSCGCAVRTVRGFGYRMEMEGQAAMWSAQTEKLRR